MQDRGAAGDRRPVERLVRSLSRVSPSTIVAVGFALTSAAALLDHLTGPNLASMTFYLVPVALVAWAGKRWQGMLNAALAGALWTVAEAATGREYASAWVFVWNSVTRLVVFLVVAFLLHHSRMAKGDAVVGPGGAACPHCGSTDTVLLRLGLVCRSCKRLSAGDD